MSEVAFTVMDLRGPRPRRSRAPLSQRVSRADRRPRRARGAAVLSRVSRARPRQDRAAARGTARQPAPRAARRSPSRAATCGWRAAIRGAAAAGIDHHLRALGLRQDGDFAGVAGGDRRGARPQRRRAQASARSCRARASATADIAQGLYAPAATEATYDRLRALARDILAAGRIAIVDATFLRQAQRESFRRWLADLAVPFVIVAFEASEATLRERIVATSRRGRRRVRRRSRGARAPDRDARAADGRREDATPSPTTPKRRSKRHGAVRLGPARGPAGRRAEASPGPPSAG